MKTFLAIAVLTAALVAVIASHAPAEVVRPPNRGGMTKSLGLPPRYKWHVGGSLGGQFQSHMDLTAQARLGVFKNIVNPAANVVGLLLEGYGGGKAVKVDGGSRLYDWDYGARASIASPFLRFAAGMDYNGPTSDFNFILTLFFPLRRSGIFGHGTDVRFEWLPSRGHTFNLALTVPLWRHSGKTRPQRSYVKIEGNEPEPFIYEQKDPSLEEALGNLRDLSHWIARLTTPYLDHNAWSRGGALKKFEADMRDIDGFLSSDHPLFPEGVTSEGVVRRFHEELDRAFSIAMGGRPLELGRSTHEGRLVAARSKEIILEEVILAYNRSLGQFRKKDTTGPFAVNARGEFVRWVIKDIDNLAAESDRWRAAAYVFVEFLNMIEANHEFMRKRWEDSRLGWLPLQYALVPEQHDSQEEIDVLIERITGERLTPGNKAWYLQNEQFQYEFYRQVQEARDYHVLWVHDYRGKNSEGNPDLVGFEQTKGYLTALIDRVREYDSTGKIPVYMIIIDQFFWEPNKGRVWSALLQDPLSHDLGLGKKDFRWMEEEIGALQDELRAAVSESRLLQAQARQYGKKWLENQVKVHVNITNPGDYTFRVQQVIPLVGFPDDVMRDHRKISFYDITEEDPYRGRAIYTGMGIGEHYTGPTWEDRAVLAQGPALLSLKYAARDLFLSQGFREEEVPYPLQVFPKHKDYEALVADNTRVFGGHPARAMQVHNRTGYSAKPANLIKAILHTMMPAGSVLKAPDSLWNNPLWASMLFGNALKGGRVLVIAPSLAGAPSSGAPQMSRAQELLERLMIIREVFADNIDAAGGLFRVGLYDPQVGVGDVVGRSRAFRKALDEHPFLRDLYPFHPSALETLDSIVKDLEEMDFEEQYLISGELKETPKLHLKAQLCASRQAWDKMIARPEWAEAIRVVGKYRLRSLSGDEPMPDLDVMRREYGEVGLRIVNGHMGDLTAEERKGIVYYLSVGSQNMNYRSMMMDGEATYLVTYFDALIGILDFVNMTGLCRWPDSREELDEIIKPYGGFKRKFGRFIKTGV